jgi:hypothetical protein
MIDPQGGLVLPRQVVQGDVPARIIATRSGKARNMYARVAIAPGGIDTSTFTLYVNGVPTTLIVVVTGVATAGSNLVDEVAVSQGDELEVIPGMTGFKSTSCRVDLELA